MEITFKGTAEEIKQEMQDFLAGAATSETVEVVTSEGVKELPKDLVEAVTADDPEDVVEYPKRTKAETQALMKKKISSPEGRKAVMALLGRFDVSKFTQLPEEHYGEFYAGLESVE